MENKGTEFSYVQMKLEELLTIGKGEISQEIQPEIEKLAEVLNNLNKNETEKNRQTLQRTIERVLSIPQTMEAAYFNLPKRLRSILDILLKQLAEKNNELKFQKKIAYERPSIKKRP